MEKTQSSIVWEIISFPCHRKEKILVSRDASGLCSAKCPSCDKFALFHLREIKAEQSSAVRGVAHRKKSAVHTYID